MSAIELAAALFGLICVYLSVRQIIWSWPVGIVSVALYILVLYQDRLYAGMALQVIYIPLSVYGWYEWLHGGPKRTALSVSRTTVRYGIIVLLVGAVGAWITGAFLRTYTDADLAYLDSAATSTSLVAQWMMTRKLLECWLVWIAVDIVYVGMFIYKELYLTAGLYAVFCVLAVMGYREWKASLGERKAELTVVSDQ